MIADFESGVAEVDCNGVWRSNIECFNDGTPGGSQTPITSADAAAEADGPGACGTSHSFHTTASGFPNQAGFGAEYVPLFEGASDALWAIIFRGIAFYARAATPTSFRLSVPDLNTAEAGGLCNPNAAVGEPNRCGDYFGGEVWVTTDWQRFEVDFADLVQAGWGDNGVASVEPRALYGIRFEAAGPEPHDDYELWIDEIHFWDDGLEACVGHESAATEAWPLIDDFDDGDPFLPEFDGRLGVWYTVHDDTPGGVQNPRDWGLPTQSGAHGSAYSMHTSGHGFTEWGALVGVNANQRGRIPCVYDASAYDGIRFYAKGENGIKFRVATVSTNPPELGGNCTTECYDHYGVNIILSTEWVLYSYGWDELGPESGESSVPFEPREILQIQFETYPMEDFDFYIDDLSFIRRAD